MFDGIQSKQSKDEEEEEGAADRGPSFGVLICCWRRMGGGGEEPVATSAVLISTSKHISGKCGVENRAFLNCKRNDANPESCLPQGQKVTRCVVSMLRELHETCPKAMDAFTKCMDYYGNEFELCRKQQQEFEKSCPL